MERIDVTWYIVFTDNDVQDHWLHSFLRRGFRHCYCLRQIGEYVYYANPTTSNIDSKIITGMPIEDYIFQEHGDNIVLKFKYPFDFNNRMFSIWNMLPTCVNVVKLFLGLKLKAQTPYQLYRQLRREGGEIL